MNIKNEQLQPAICILAAGLGRRMESLSNKPKALLKLKDRTILSNLIDKIPIKFDIIIAVGYKSEFIKDFCEKNYTDRNFIFVDILDFESKNSGPGVSLKFCERFLQRPFYLAVSDCYFTEDTIPPIDCNWIGICKTNSPHKYSTVNIDSDGNITELMNKSLNGFDNAAIGIFSILEYKVFWQELNKNLSEGEFVSAFYNIKAYTKIKYKKFDWYDVGTIIDYNDAKKTFEN